MSKQMDRLVWVVEQLRLHCPWTRRLTHPVLTEYLVEEAYEAVEVIESRTAAWDAAAVADGDDERLRLEMGDVLFQVVLHAAIASGHGGFTLDTVAEAITAKMIRRNPHVFHPDGTLRSEQELAAATVEDIEKAWERIKAQERTTTPAPSPSASGSPDASAPESPLASLPAHLPALAAAGKVVDRAARQAVDPLPAAEGPSSGSDLERALRDEEALGAELFRTVQLARRAGLDPERALRRHLAVLTGRRG